MLELTREDVRLVGWWDAAVPARTDHPEILVSAYLRPGNGCVLALASWAPSTAKVVLKIDWAELGLTPEVASISAPAIAGFQNATEFSAVTPTLTVEMARGWLLDVRSGQTYV